MAQAEGAVDSIRDSVRPLYNGMRRVFGDNPGRERDRKLSGRDAEANAAYRKQMLDRAASSFRKQASAPVTKSRTAASKSTAKRKASRSSSRGR